MKKTSQNKPPANNDSAPVKKPKLLFVGEGPDDVGRDATPGGAAAGFLHAALKGPSPPIDDDSLPFIIDKIQYWDRSGKRHQFRSDGGSHLEVGYVRVFSAFSFEAALSICFLPLLPSFSSPFLFS
jgi:hypothetical protein